MSCACAAGMAIHTTAAAANQARVKADLDIAPLLLPEKPVLSLSDRTTRAVRIKAYRFRQSKSGAQPPVAHAVISPPAARRRATSPAVSSKATAMWWALACARIASSVRARTADRCDRDVLLRARRPAPLAEPDAVLRHLPALRSRRIPLAGRRLFGVLRRAPPQLDAVVEIVRHLKTERSSTSLSASVHCEPLVRG